MKQQSLVGNAIALMASTAAQAGLGLLFWVIGARSFSGEALGIDAALITMMSTIGIVGQLNVGNALVRFLPQLGNRSAHWVIRAYGIGVVAAASLAAAFVIVAPSVSSRFALLDDTPTAIGFVIAVAAWVIFLLEDAVLVATRYARWTVVENVSFGVLKIVVLAVCATLGWHHGAFVAWVLPLIVLLPAVNYLIFARVLPAHAGGEVTVGALMQSPRRRLLAFIGQDYLGVVMSQASLTALPLVVVALVGDRANAYFYVAFTIATLLDVLVYNAMTSLTVEAAHDEENLRRLALLATRRLLAPLVGAAALLVVVAPLLLAPYGEAFVHDGVGPLRLLACALPFRAVVFLFDAVCRVQGRGGRIVATQLAGFVLLVPLTIVLAGKLGLDGVGLAWLLSAVIVAAAVSPMLWRALRPPAPAVLPSPAVRVPAAASPVTAAPDLVPVEADAAPDFEHPLVWLALALSVLAPTAVALDAAPGVRLVLVLGFFATAPGTAILAATRRPGAPLSPGLAVALSLATTVVVAEAMLSLHAWDPRTSLAVFALLTAGVIVYARHGITRALRRERAAPEPMWVGELELSEPILDVRPPRRAGGEPYTAARILVRLHSHPVGFVTVPITGRTIPAQQLVDTVSAELGAEVVRRLAADAQAEHGRLSVEGIQAALDDSFAADEIEAHLPTVSVIVCTRDRAESLHVALTSILETGYPNLELVVVDNAPKTSATRDVVDALDDQRVRYVLEPRPGLSRARNIGVIAARGEFVAFTDDDVIVDPLWVDGLVRGLTRSPDVGLVTGLVAPAELETRAQLYFEAKVQWSGSCQPELFDLDEHRHDHPLYPYSAGLFGTGANFGATRTALTRIGPFDEALGAGSPAQGGEDLDYFLRTLFSGQAIAFEPAALVWHVHRREDEALVTQMWGYGAGLGAYVSKYLSNPRTAFELLRLLPRGVVRFARINRQVANAVPPLPLTQRTELRGLLAGPASYLRGRRLLRHTTTRPDR